MDIESLSRDELLAIVRRLPRTADGVPAAPGDWVWVSLPDGAYSVPTPVVRVYLGDCYSTREAAERAATAG